MNLPKETAELLEAYFAGDPSPETIEAMEAWLREDPAHPRLLAEYGLIDRLIAHEQKNQDASAIFAALLDAEDSADPDFSLLHTTAFETTPEKTDEQSITFRDLYSAASYLTAKGLRTKAAMYGAIAAVLVLGAVLYLSIFGLGTTPESPEIADQTPSTPAVERADIVATLTASHNATWAAGASAPGSQLRAGQRLTLSAGFAEIKTNRGAIAILEAPATIELLDNDNALRLHSGKLVGICETPTSKGFLVRTPHIDITDLGTRFGVEVVAGSGSEVHVFDGEVRVNRDATGPAASQRRVLVAGQAVLAKQDTSDALFEPMAAALDRFKFDRFTQDADTPRVADTGGGLVSGDIDPDWTVVAVDGKAVTENTEMTVWSHPDNEVTRADSKWVRVNNVLNPPDARSVLFTCRSVFDLPADVAAASHELVIRARADNSLAAIRINGHALEVPKNRVGVGPEWLTWTLTEHFVPGTNTIEIDIDERLPDNNKPNSSGLIAEFELQTR